MPERRPHTVYVAVEIDAYDWIHAVDCVRAEFDAMDRSGHVSPMFNDVTTLNITGREDVLEIAGTMYHREREHDPRDRDALRVLEGAVIMAESTPSDVTRANNLRDAIFKYYRSVTGRGMVTRLDV